MTNLAYNYATRQRKRTGGELPPWRRGPLVVACVSVGLLMFVVGRAFAYYVTVVAP